MRFIAVLTSNIESTTQWMKDNYKIKQINLSQRMLLDESGVTFLLVSSREDILGWEFSDLIISPQYDDLVNLVKSRIRLKDMNDLIILDDIDEDLVFKSINLNVFEIYARHKKHSLVIQPTIEDAKKIRDWLSSLLIEVEE
jgi:hypothetical protein